MSFNEYEEPTEQQRQDFLPDEVAKYLNDRPHVLAIIDQQKEQGGLSLHRDLIESQTIEGQYLRVSLIEALTDATDLLRSSAEDWFEQHGTTD